MPQLVIERHLTARDLVVSLRRDVRDGLTGTAKSLPPKWGYDERGSELFEQITGLREYHLTRAERSILLDRATELAELTGADTLIELGAGSGEKTRLLLDALREAGHLRRYVPVDVSADFLADAARRIGADYPGLSVRAIVADFEGDLGVLPREGRRLVAFLGSTAGNMAPAERLSFYTDLRSAMNPADALLLGLDLVMDPSRLESAYDDALGLSAEFNRNLLRVINRELGADFDPELFEHVSLWDPQAECIRRRLRATKDQQVLIRDLELEVGFTAGEEIDTEISDKFRHREVRDELERAGFALVRWWTDLPGDFALCLAVPAPG